MRTVCHESVPARSRPIPGGPAARAVTGRPARGLLFAEGRDKGLHVFFIQRGELTDEAIATVARRLQARASDGRYDLGMDEIARLLDSRGEKRRPGASGHRHLARAGGCGRRVVADRVAARIEAPFDGARTGRLPLLGR